MERFLNPRYTKPLRKVLRKDQTGAEKVLWQRLRNRQLNGLKFYRQFGVDRYILDFCCIEAMIVIELDGGQHEECENKQNDEVRTRFLEAKGFQVFRFLNREVFDNVEGILVCVLERLKNSPNPSSKEGDMMGERIGLD